MATRKRGERILWPARIETAENFGKFLQLINTRGEVLPK